VAYSYDPRLATVPSDRPAEDRWEGLRTLYAERAPHFLRTLLPGLDVAAFRHVPHHLAHAASAWGHAPFETCAVMVLDGRGERGSYLAGRARGATFEPIVDQELPHSLGLRYEELTAHLGYRRSSDEYKVMAMASYGRPAHLDELRRLLRTTGDGGFVTEEVDWSRFAPPGLG